MSAPPEAYVEGLVTGMAYERRERGEAPPSIIDVLRALGKGLAASPAEMQQVRSILSKVGSASPRLSVRPATDD